LVESLDSGIPPPDNIYFLGLESTVNADGEMTGAGVNTENITVKPVKDPN
jgi:hypothetical protein